MSTWRENLNPIMIMGFLFCLVAVYLVIDDFTGGWLIGVCCMTGSSLLFVDVEVKKLKTRLDKLETPSAPPETQEV